MACSKRSMVVFIVFVALLLDNLMLTCIVPILPNYFRERRHSNRLDDDHHSPHSHGQHHRDINAMTTSYPLPPDHHRHAVSSLRAEFMPDATNVVGHIMKDSSRSALHHSDSTTKHRSNGSTSHDDGMGENTKMGLLLGTKTFVQMVCNLFVGHLTHRIGYTIPMFSGFVILLFSTVLFAFTESYTLLFVARSIQGLGTALSTTSGMGLLASLFTDQKERAFAQTIAFSGLAAGVLIGPPYGGVLYDLTGGKEIPCLILAGVTLLEGILQLLVIRPKYDEEEKPGNSYMKLCCDPYIFVTAATIVLSSLNVAVLEPVLPIWMYHTMGASAWQQGMAFVPSTLSYLVCLQICGTLAHRMQCCDVTSRWASAFVGIVLLGASLTTVPFCTSLYYLIPPLVVNGVGLALVTSSMLPHVGYLVDIRHEPSYGSAYALTDNAFCMAFAIGPAISGPMVDNVGFSWTLILMGAVSVVFSPIVCLLKRATPYTRVGTVQTEKTPLVSSSVKFSAAKVSTSIA